MKVKIRTMKLPRKIDICGHTFKIKKTKGGGGAFSFDDRTIEVGEDYKNQEDIIEVLIHEISEVIHVILALRTLEPVNNSYVFSMTYKDFQTHNTILVQTLIANKILII